MSSEFAAVTEGTLRYNGWDFPAAVQVRVNGRPVMDTSGRYVKWVRYTISVACVLFPGVDDHVGAGALVPESLESLDGTSAGIHAGLQALRKRLTEQGKEFHFIGKGFGYDFSIHTGIRDDVEHGPRIVQFDCQPIASNKAYRLLWGVEVSTTECEAYSNLKWGFPTEVTIDASYSISNGLTTRTVRGTYEIANGAIGGFDNRQVDHYRESITVAVPDQFIRENQEWAVAADNRHLRFAIVDRQSESEVPPLPGVARQRVRHRMNSAGPYPGVRWVIQLTGRFTVAPGVSKVVAWTLFLLHLKAKRDAAPLASVSSDENGDPKRDWTTIPLKLSLDDDVTGLEFSATYSYMLVIRDASEALRAAGMFQRVDTGVDWRTYNFFMSNQVWTARGVAGLRQTPRPAALPCNPTSAASRFVDLHNEPFGSSLESPLWDDSCDGEYILFESSASHETDHKTAPLHPTGGAAEYLPTPGNDYDADSSGRRPIVTQKRGDPRSKIVFAGEATRVGKHVERPKLLEYGGLTLANGELVPIGQGKLVQTMKRVVDCEVWHAVWYQEYAVKGIPFGEEYRYTPDVNIPR